ncbi:MAG: S23 ribosomal protein [Microgenomates group bacterium Gr01-1014_7]|nr:MAG: S23 ribosomal protein [Microgenomates group bacterium Gr01-1014_7]
MIDKSTKGYHKLILWSKLKELLTLTYKLTDKLPKNEEFGLTPQMRRAMVSVISNFVEGYLKSSKKHKSSFMEIANTSLMELEGQSEVCLMLGYWTDEDYEIFDKKRSEAGYFLYRYKLSLK